MLPAQIFYHNSIISWWQGNCNQSWKYATCSPFTFITSNTTLMPSTSIYIYIYIHTSNVSVALSLRAYIIVTSTLRQLLNIILVSSAHCSMSYLCRLLNAIYTHYNMFTHISNVLQVYKPHLMHMIVQAASSLQH